MEPKLKYISYLYMIPLAIITLKGSAHFKYHELYRKKTKFESVYLQKVLCISIKILIFIEQILSYDMLPLEFD